MLQKNFYVWSIISKLILYFFGTFALISFDPTEIKIFHIFTEGKSVKEMVDEALRRIPNSDG